MTTIRPHASTATFPAEHPLDNFVDFQIPSIGEILYFVPLPRPGSTKQLMPPFEVVVTNNSNDGYGIQRDPTHQTTWPSLKMGRYIATTMPPGIV